MSRKTFLAVIGIIGVVLVFFRDQFGFGDLALGGVITSLGVILTWILFEAKADIKRVFDDLKAQKAKWADPKFWMAFIAALLPVLNSSLGLNLPVETINIAVGAIITVLFGILFKKDSTA